MEHKEESVDFGWENSSENAVQGLGQAYYNNGFLYYTDTVNLYEYDLLSREVITIVGEEGISLSGIYATDKEVYYKTGITSQATRRVPFDTQISEKAYTITTAHHSFCLPYYEKELVYGLSAQMGEVIRYYRDTEEKEVLDTEVLMYAKEEGNLYYIKYSSQPHLVKIGEEIEVSKLSMVK